jgi:hypothetical protein
MALRMDVTYIDAEAEEIVQIQPMAFGLRIEKAMMSVAVLMSVGSVAGL